MENESTLEINLKNAKSRLEAAHSICSSLIKENAILKSRASQFESTIKETMKARDELKEKLKIATEALEFYGNTGQWVSMKQSSNDTSIIYNDVELIATGPVLIPIGGKRAREALDKLKKELQNEN